MTSARGRVSSRKTALGVVLVAAPLVSCQLLAGLEGSRHFVPKTSNRSEAGPVGSGGTSTEEAGLLDAAEGGRGSVQNDSGRAGGGDVSDAHSAGTGSVQNATRDAREAGIDRGRTRDGGRDGGDAASAGGGARIVHCDGSPCSVPPSCDGLAWTCGPHHDEDCCAAPPVPGGTFNRSNDTSYPASVSPFRLDRFEITVGRFRKFVEAYPANVPVPGSGRNLNDPSDGGWDPSWDAKLPPTQSDLTTSLSFLYCGRPLWTDSPDLNESRPINCVNWYVAQAFCIWDQARLPTEAEWNFAAAGGAQQRVYPWSAPPIDTTIGAAYAVYSGGYCDAPSPFLESGACDVGSKSPLGDGEWGQADLAGNLFEIVFDGYASPYAESVCDNCAHLGAQDHVIRGGSWASSASLLETLDRHGTSFSGAQSGVPTVNQNGEGARCARAP